MLYDKHTVYLKMAKEMSVLSHCVSKQVSCLLVSQEGRVISSGINGTPKGYENCNEKFPHGWCEEHHSWSLIHEVHAEMNAINDAARRGVSTEGTIAYCTLKPCFNCTKQLISAGITSIHYIEDYDKNDDVTLDALLDACNVRITQHKVI